MSEFLDQLNLIKVKGENIVVPPNSRHMGFSSEKEDKAFPYDLRKPYKLIALFQGQFYSSEEELPYNIEILKRQIARAVYGEIYDTLDDIQEELYDLKRHIMFTDIGGIPPLERLEKKLYELKDNITP